MDNLFDLAVINNTNLKFDDIEEYKEIIIKTNFSGRDKKKAIEYLERLYKITQFKNEFNYEGSEEELGEVITFLEDNYYNKRTLTSMIDLILKIIFTPPYFQNHKGYVPHIPNEFWPTNLGKIILSVLCANDDILVSSAEAASILDFSRQNVHVLARENKIPTKKTGGFTVFKLYDVLTYKYRDVT